MSAFIVQKNELIEWTDEWHVGLPVLVVGTIYPIDVKNVIEVQADGDELDIIWNTPHESIPFIARKRVQTWYGDMAKFIVKNIFMGGR